MSIDVYSKLVIGTRLTCSLVKHKVTRFNEVTGESYEKDVVREFLMIGDTGLTKEKVEELPLHTFGTDTENEPEVLGELVAVVREGGPPYEVTQEMISSARKHVEEVFNDLGIVAPIGLYLINYVSF